MLNLPKNTAMQQQEKTIKTIDIFVLAEHFKFILQIFYHAQEKARGCRLAWSRLVDLGSIDPGSNPGSPTKLLIVGESLFLAVLV